LTFSGSHSYVKVTDHSFKVTRGKCSFFGGVENSVWKAELNRKIVITNISRKVVSASDGFSC